MVSKHLKLIGLGVMVALQTGCSALSLGEDEFACSGDADKGVCMGLHEVYEQTHNHDNLNHLMKSREQLKQEESDRIDAEANGQGQAATAPRYHGPHGKGRKARAATAPSPAVAVDAQASAPGVVAGPTQSGIYEPRNHARQYPNAYQQARLVEGEQRMGMPSGELGQLQQFSHVPNNIAPEPLAVLEPAQTMRILINAYTDQGGDLHMPGYVYVELKPRRWSVGTHATNAPARIVPLQIIQQSNTQLKESKRRSQGVTGLGVMQPQLNKNGG